MAIQTLERMGVERVFDAGKVVVVPDHHPGLGRPLVGLQRRLKDWCVARGSCSTTRDAAGSEHAVPLG
jgi:hypothetical protein